MRANGGRKSVGVCEGVSMGGLPDGALAKSGSFSEGGSGFSGGS